ncbi:FxLYD domain-containing protein [Thermosynechococcus sp. GLH187]|uniref:FxLYD domain-containing protein n=1 Tax=unclassified Thermosynechococcus TaxID=2622553 RepID=UPI0028781168|nr:MULTISPECIES: FxLYD domain-containing protein [unclassified Thermosynechococcus]WNC46007.1 FxLYD domain-containing protein [Thermosynechococcus sp. GLH187]WNC48543.1 FxLYD domain-containing protein [Thermosynechococcus sp. GLH333]WNC51076.1 FxLYD domain-containing protein [Thermosynechococcus sp. GLH87]
MLKITRSPFPLWLTSIVLLGAIAPLPALAQRAAGDIVIIGNSPYEWGRNQRYWNHLLNLSGATAAASTPTPSETPQEVDPKVLEQQLLRNIRVGQPQLQPVLKLPGSSVVTGTVTNNNRQPVTIQSVNYEVVGPNGQILQTGAATPEPATVDPGQTVTYQQMLPTVPADIGARVRLMQPAVRLQGGV